MLPVNKLRFVELFAGIGGFSLGFERSDMECIGHVEIDPYAKAVLKARWPDVPIYDDVKKIKGDEFGDIDLLCGGFPCTDISVAGKRKGLVDETGKTTRSGLFFEIMRIARVCRPRWIVLENVAALFSKPEWAGAILGSLAEIGYDAEWEIIQASDVGAPHQRARVWIVAWNPNSSNESEKRKIRQGTQTEQVADTECLRPIQCESQGQPRLRKTTSEGGSGRTEHVADTPGQRNRGKGGCESNGEGSDSSRKRGKLQHEPVNGSEKELADTDNKRGRTPQLGNDTNRAEENEIRRESQFKSSRYCEKVADTTSGEPRESETRNRGKMFIRGSEESGEDRTVADTTGKRMEGLSESKGTSESKSSTDLQRREYKEITRILDFEYLREHVWASAAKSDPNWAGGTAGQPSPVTEFEEGREIECDFRGMAYGVSSRVDRIRCLGNALIPQISEILGKKIVAVNNFFDDFINDTNY